MSNKFVDVPSSDGDAFDAYLSLPASGEVMETDEVLIVGFPFGKGFSTNRSTPVVTVFPRIEKTESGAVVRIPAEAGYGVEAMPVDDMMR